MKYWIKENHSPNVTTTTKMQTNSESTVFPWIPKHTTGLYIVWRTLSHILCYGAEHIAVQVTKQIFIYALTKRTLRTIINGSSQINVYLTTAQTHSSFIHPLLIENQEKSALEIVVAGLKILNGSFYSSFCFRAVILILHSLSILKICFLEDTPDWAQVSRLKGCQNG